MLLNERLVLQLALVQPRTERSGSLAEKGHTEARQVKNEVGALVDPN